MNYLNADVRDAIRRFRDNYDKILGKKHTMTVTFAYATKSDQAAHEKVLSRAAHLKTFVKSQISYDQIFSPDYNRDLYVASILIQRQVEKYLVGRGADLKDVRSIIRYYVTMVVACTLLKKIDPPSDKDVAGLLPETQKGLAENLLKQSTELVMKAYKGVGENEIVAKSSEMTTLLKAWLPNVFAGKEILI